MVFGERPVPVSKKNALLGSFSPLARSPIRDLLQKEEGNVEEPRSCCSLGFAEAAWTFPGDGGRGRGMGDAGKWRRS